MKLLTVIETLGQGGAERVLLNTLPKLKDLGVDCEVAMLFQKDDLKEELEKKGIKVHKLDIRNRWNIVSAVNKLDELVRRGNFDILHAHIFFAHFYTGLLKLRNRNFKSVVTFHNMGYNTYPATTLWRKIRKKIDSYVVNRMIDYRTGVSTAVKEHYKEHLNLRQIDLVHNGFPTDDIHAAVKSTNPFGEFEEKFVVVTPGRLVKEKGHHYLLNSVQKINQRIKSDEILFVIVGKGPLLRIIQDQIATLGLKNVRLAGALPHRDLLNYLNYSDMVIIPSISEGFPMIIGEAMILGKPILTTSVGGIPDFIDQHINGIMVAAKDSEGLADEFYRLYADKERLSRLAENARTKSHGFDINIIAVQWMAIYHTLVNEN